MTKSFVDMLEEIDILLALIKQDAESWCNGNGDRQSAERTLKYVEQLEDRISSVIHGPKPDMVGEGKLNGLQDDC